jgi:alcohol dehydrogenase class IV
MAVGNFIYQPSPQRIVFGSGTLAQLPGEAARLGLKRALILSTPGHKKQAEDAARLLDAACGGVFAGARMHTPIEVTETAMTIVREQGIDGTVAIGGGSTTGLGKAIAFRTDLPQIVVPTTYAGSEMTNILGETVAGTKRTTRDPRILPEVVIYDVELTLTLPPLLSVTSGMNAIAHAVEGLYAKDGNPILSLMAEEGIRALATAFPRIKANALDPPARAEALYGAWLCGTVLAGTTMALHHKLCHVLGGSFNLPHAETHTIILPHVAAYNASAALDATKRVAGALGCGSAGQGLFDLARQNGGPTALRDIGMPEAGLDLAAALATESSYWNPRPVERAGIRALLDDAWHGRRPPND